MAFKRIVPKDVCSTNLYWTAPVSYEKIIEQGSDYDEGGSLYMILGYRRSSHPELFYIGKVTQNHVSARLRQPDHKERYLRLRKKNPSHRFRVSLGGIVIEGMRLTHRHIDQIETILIQATRESQPLINKSKLFSHRISEAYHIQNHSHRRPLPKEIYLGIFTQ